MLKNARAERERAAVNLFVNLLLMFSCRWLNLCARPLRVEADGEWVDVCMCVCKVKLNQLNCCSQITKEFISSPFSPWSAFSYQLRCGRSR